MLGWLAKIKNKYYWIDSNNVSQNKVLSPNDYTYNNSGMRLTNAIQLYGSSTRTETYGYDELYRLTSVNYGDGQTQGYSFDTMGNRSQKTDSVNGTENYTYNNANMLLSRGSNNYTNDADGNTLTGGGRTNTWDSQNRLATCVNGSTTSNFTYASDGLRHKTVSGSNTTDYVLDASMFIREKLNGSVKATYLVGPRGPEYRRDDQAATIKWYCYDGLGSVLAEVDATGNLAAVRNYDVYGLVRSSTGTSTSNHKFVGSLGHPSEAETGLIYMRARYMDPVCGRFVSEDPARHGSNWQLYCGNNPVCRVDRSGKSWDDIIEAFIIQIIGYFVALAGFTTDFLNGIDGLNGVRAKLHFLRAWLSRVSHSQDAVIAEGLIEEESGQAEIDPTGGIAAHGALEAKRGMEVKAVALIERGQIDILEVLLNEDGFLIPMD